MRDENNVHKIDKNIKHFFELINDEKEEEILNYLKSDNQYKIWEYINLDEEAHLTVLHTAALKKNFEITNMILDYVEKNNKNNFITFINKADKKGMTALHYASFKGSLIIIKLLIKKGADETIITKKKKNVIHFCAEGNSSSCLLYYYFRFKYKDKEEEEENKNSNLLKLFKNEDDNGSTPLHWAAYSGSLETLLYLINLDIFRNENERQEYIDKKDNKGCTALHLSINVKNSEIITKLLQYGATPNIKAPLDKTPYELAIEKGLYKIAKYINNYQKCHLCTPPPIKKNNRTYKNILIFFLCLLLSAFILLFSTIPICLNDNTIGKFIFFFYIILLSLYFIVYLILLFLNPGIVPADNESVLNGLLEKNINLNNYCYKCYISKKKNIKHCVICDKCFEEFDHHCFWINKCIAKNNIFLFRIFFFESFLYIIFSFVLNFYAIYKIIECKSCALDNKNYYIDCIKIVSEYICGGVHFGMNILLFLMTFYFLITECILPVINNSNCCKDKKYGDDSIKIKKKINESLIADNQRYTLINKSMIDNNLTNSTIE